MSVHEISPLSEPVYLALLALMRGPLHGYAIITTVEDWTGGRIRLRTGTLYTALQRLEEAGFIAESDAAMRHRDGRGRRVFRLTASGRALVRTETTRLRELVDLAASVQGRA